MYKRNDQELGWKIISWPWGGERGWSILEPSEFELKKKKKMGNCTWGS